MHRRVQPLAVGLGCLASLVAAAEPPPAGPPEAAAAPVIADEPRTIDPADFVPAALAKKASVEFEDSSLREIVAWLREELGLTVLLNNLALDDIGVSPAEPVSDRLSEAPVYQLLDRLRHLELQWYHENGIIHITTEEDAFSRLVTVTHNVGDLLDAGYNTDQLIEVITATIAADTWAENGGGEAEVSAIGDVLFISQTQSVQRSVRALLAGLRDHGRQTLVNDPIEHQRLREQLDALVRVEFDETPLVAAVSELAAQAGIDLRVDLSALREIGVREREPVRLVLADQKLSVVLEAMLRDFELTWMMEDGVLWVTSEEEASTRLKTAIYDVRDLCRDASETEALIEAITSQTDVDTWAENGGGEAQARDAGPGVLVVAQEQKVQERVLRLLEAYRTALRSSKRRHDPDKHANEIVTVYYRLYDKTAAYLLDALPQIVEPESWRSEDRPDGVGTLRMVPSEPDASAANAKGLPNTGAEIERAVLIVRQTRVAHEQISEMVRRIRTGDPDPAADGQQGGLGGGGGGLRGGGGSFGGGAFAVPTLAP